MEGEYNNQKVGAQYMMRGRQMRMQELIECECKTVYGERKVKMYEFMSIEKKPKYEMRGQ